MPHQALRKPKGQPQARTIFLLIECPPGGSPVRVNGSDLTGPIPGSADSAKARGHPDSGQTHPCFSASLKIPFKLVLENPCSKIPAPVWFGDFCCTVAVVPVDDLFPLPTAMFRKNCKSAHRNVKKRRLGCPLSDDARRWIAGTAETALLRSCRLERTRWECATGTSAPFGFRTTTTTRPCALGCASRPPVTGLARCARRSGPASSHALRPRVCPIHTAAQGAAFHRGGHRQVTQCTHPLAQTHAPTHALGAHAKIHRSIS